MATLDALIPHLRKEDGTIAITGHADPAGSDAPNCRLSRYRADAVVGYLSSKDIDPQRIDVRAFGERCPVAPRPTASPQQADRRVEIECSVCEPPTACHDPVTQPCR